MVIVTFELHLKNILLIKKSSILDVISTHF